MAEGTKLGRLEGKVCLITGAGSGIGQATARLFAREGGSVVVADVDDRGAKATVSEIRKAGGVAAAEHVDVTDEAETVALVARVVKRLKRIVQAVIGNPYLSLGALAAVALIGVPVAFRLPARARAANPS